MKIINTLLAVSFVQSKLMFDSDGKFKVLQITDIHYGEDEQKDTLTTGLLEKLIEIEKPNVAVLTGDMVSGYAWDKTEGWYERQWKKWTEAFIKTN
jgi:predicted MPP superfamily phosphohydrolase